MTTVKNVSFRLCIAKKRRLTVEFCLAMLLLYIDKRKQYSHIHN